MFIVNPNFRFIIDSVIIILLSFIFYHLLNKLITKQIKKFLLQKREHYLLLYFFQSIQKPLTILILLLGITTTLEIISEHYQKTTTELIITVKIIILIGLISWFILGFLRRIEYYFIKESSNKDKVNKSTVTMLTKLVSVIVFILAILSLMQTLGLEIQALLAFGGLSGAAIGLGARDFIANLFGTMMIYLEKPFNIGDEIKFNNLEGRVENITWRSTHLKSNNQKFICLPNAQFLTIAVQNCSRYNDNIVICNITFNTYDQNRAFELLEFLAEMLKVQVNSCIYECTYSTNHTVKFKVTIVSQLDNKYLKQIITLEIYKLSQNIAFDLIFEQI